MKRIIRHLTGQAAPQATAAADRDAATPMPKRVWRVSDHMPMGMWVDPSIVPEAAQRGFPEAAESGWIVSPLDFLNGTDIDENAHTEPGEFDALFPAGVAATSAKPSKP